MSMEMQTKTTGAVIFTIALILITCSLLAESNRFATQLVPELGINAAENILVGAVGSSLGELAEVLSAQSGEVYYVHPGGGTAEQCNGLSNDPYPGKGMAVDCAWGHLFYAFPPGGESLIDGGDTLYIAAGSYRMGFGAPDPLGACSPENASDCYMSPIPSGPDSSHLTRIFGEGWDTGCNAPPELWGAEGAARVLNLDGSSNVQVGCLEITDHSGCVENHTGGLACQNETPPFGDWAYAGLYAADSTKVYLKGLNIHGMAGVGIHAGRLSNWRVEDVRLTANGWAGWDGDLWDGEDTNAGVMYFRNWTVSWNGCAESYPDQRPTGCWGQSAGGYGDGVGTGLTSGHWIIEESAFLNNTSDGLDLLYARLPGASIEIRRSIAQGNAGNQIKTSGPLTIENSIIAGNCGFFEGQPFTHQVDNCRALGSSLVINLLKGNQASVVNNTLTSQGDCLVIASCDEDGNCNGTEKVLLRNNILYGQVDFLQPDQLTCLVYAENLPGEPFDVDYSLISNVKDDACPGPNDVCVALPGLANPAIDVFDAHLLESSPAVDAGTSIGAPASDYAGHPRDAIPDIGAYEWWQPTHLQYLPFAIK